MPEIWVSHSNEFLGAFAKWRKATVSFVIPVCLSVCLSVCPSVRLEQLRPHLTDFYEISYLNIFQKSVERIRISLKSDENDGYV